jgi:zinc transporter, ZIP family
MSENAKDNVAVAMGLVVAAGLSTGLGAAVVFFPSLVNLASRRVLAGSLGFSAGVMTYVSFVEIFAKSKKSFEDAGFDVGRAYSFATVCFFGGVATMMVRRTQAEQVVGSPWPAVESHSVNHHSLSLL